MCASFISPVFELPAVKTASSYLLPALFGSMALGLFASSSSGSKVVKGGIKGVLPVLIIMTVVSIAARLAGYGSVLGGLVGQLITFDTTGIDFALTALFIVILLDQIKSTGMKLPALIGGVSSVLCIIILGRDNFLLPSLAVTVLVLLILRNNLEGGAENEH